LSDNRMGIMSRNRILMTTALPYANASIHLGHIFEHVQADIWCRFQKMKGNECVFVCADDTHGTPVMISAQNRGITPEKLIEDIQKEHFADLTGFEVEYDNYYTTHSQESTELAQSFFKAMKAEGYISEKKIEQAYCEHDKMFLPDRFVKGTCPNCGAEDQYGDNCEVCAATYTPDEVKDPFCVLCKNKPISKESLHLFFELNHFKDFLQNWIGGHTQKEVTNKMMEWFEEDLRSWDISRDAPYFGIPIPGYEGKYFYVWLDAPIGYISATKNWADKNNKNFLDYWKNEDCEIHHFIGKDITYFHTLFWPAMLKAADYNTPEFVHVHGFINVNGEKMSKSKGTFINARTYLNHADPMYLRYYYASKTSPTSDDIDLNMDDFVGRVNAELIGKITNLASRGVQMLHKKLDGKTSVMDPDGEKVFNISIAAQDRISEYFDQREFSKAMQEIRSIAEDANKYFDEKAPWKTIKEQPEETRKVLTSVINIYKNILIYLKPVLPEYSKKAEQILNLGSLSWSDLEKTLVEHPINEYVHLATRIDPDQVNKMIEEEKKNAPTKPDTKISKGLPLIEFDDFMKVDLKTAKVIECNEVEGADKLLQITADVGDGETKNIFAGIKSSYSPDQLLGKTVVIVNNLKPRKMKFGTSEAMILAVDTGNGLSIVEPEKQAKPGVRVK